MLSIARALLLLLGSLVMLNQRRPNLLHLRTQLLQHTHHLRDPSRIHRPALYPRTNPHHGRRRRHSTSPADARLRRLLLVAALCALLRRRRQQRGGHVHGAGLFERVLGVGQVLLGDLCLCGGGARLAGVEALAGGVDAAKDVGAQVLGGVLDGPGLPALVEPDDADQGRVRHLEEHDADVLRVGVGEDEEEGLEDDYGDEVLRWG